MTCISVVVNVNSLVHLDVSRYERGSTLELTWGVAGSCLGLYNIKQHLKDATVWQANLQCHCLSK